MIGKNLQLDFAVCEQARLSRDPRFDGRFFIAVTSTGIYCRSICPAPASKRTNVRYYPTAAAAAEAGFRPCLRCRPEAAPGTPAWLGPVETVNRGLRLIAEGALDNGDIGTLAARLGVSVRHLDRLFVRHLGASPLAVAQTRRLHFAKKLLDETDLPMTQVAFAAGYGSVRRFNDSICKTYGCAPSLLRRKCKSVAVSQGGQYVFRLAYRPPYEWDSLLNFFATQAIPGVESVTDGRYRRTIALGGRHGIIEIEHAVRAHALTLHIRFPESAALLQIVARVRRMFDLDADPVAIAQHFMRDPLLGDRISQHPGLRIPGAWDGFELATRAILGRRLTIAEAGKRAGLFARRYGQCPDLADEELNRIFPTPATLAVIQLNDMPGGGARAIRILARKVTEDGLRIETGTSPETLLQRLEDIPGIGERTAQYIVMRALSEPDLLPTADPGLLRAAGNGWSLRPKQLRDRAEVWRPWRAYAAMYLQRSEYGAKARS